MLSQESPKLYWKIAKKRKNDPFNRKKWNFKFFSQVLNFLQGSLNPNITILGEKLWPEARNTETVLERSVVVMSRVSDLLVFHSSASIYISPILETSVYSYNVRHRHSAQHLGMWKSSSVAPGERVPHVSQDKTEVHRVHWPRESGDAGEQQPVWWLEQIRLIQFYEASISSFLNR